MITSSQGCLPQSNNDPIEVCDNFLPREENSDGRHGIECDITNVFWVSPVIVRANLPNAFLLR